MHAQTKKTKPKYTAKPKPSANAAFIVGTWDLMQMPTGDGMNISRTWEFTKTNFVMAGYPPLNQKGIYKVIKEKGDTLTLKLYQQEGDMGREDTEQKIIINKEKETITIEWGQFKRKK